MGGCSSSSEGPLEPLPTHGISSLVFSPYLTPSTRKCIEEAIEHRIYKRFPTAVTLLTDCLAKLPEPSALEFVNVSIELAVTYTEIGSYNDILRVTSAAKSKASPGLEHDTLRLIELWSKSRFRTDEEDLFSIEETQKLFSRVASTWISKSDYTNVTETEIYAHHYFHSIVYGHPVQLGRFKFPKSFNGLYNALVAEGRIDQAIFMADTGGIHSSVVLVRMLRRLQKLSTFEHQRALCRWMVTDESPGQVNKHRPEWQALAQIFEECQDPVMKLNVEFFAGIRSELMPGEMIAHGREFAAQFQPLQSYHRMNQCLFVAWRTAFMHNLSDEFFDMQVEREELLNKIGFGFRYWTEEFQELFDEAGSNGPKTIFVFTAFSTAAEKTPIPDNMVADDVLRCQTLTQVALRLPLVSAAVKWSERLVRATEKRYQQRSTSNNSTELSQACTTHLKARRIQAEDMLAGTSTRVEAYASLRRIGSQYVESDIKRGCYSNAHEKCELLRDVIFEQPGWDGEVWVQKSLQIAKSWPAGREGIQSDIEGYRAQVRLGFANGTFPLK